MKDNFSTQAESYANYRPTYPPALFDYLLSRVANRGSAWDCATGNGQAAVALAPYFQQVVATDISEKQLAQAPKLPNITYQICPAEHTPFAENSFDLITVAQALHWFQFEAFFQEVQRVAKPNALFATWLYGLNNVSPEIDALVRHLYKPILGNYWDNERSHIEDTYAHIPFPFTDITEKHFTFQAAWTADLYIGYLNTWSSVQHYIRKNGQNPITFIEPDLRALWGNSTRHVTFPIFLKTGKVDKNFDKVRQ